MNRAIVALGLLLVGVAPVAGADEPTALQPVVVTGSRLPREPGDLLLPVTVIERRAIERSGHATVGELLFALPFNNGGAPNANNGDGGTNPGYSALSLRGAGANATLVLINGRPVAPFGFSGVAFDLESIPASAVQRVEILRDGGSALYGADAIAGVVNIILRSDFEGAEVRVGGLGGNHLGETRATATIGAPARTDGRSSWLLTLDQRRSRALAARHRDFARTAYRPERGVDATSPVGFPGAYASDLSSPYVPFSSAGLACDPAVHRGAVPSGQGTCAYDYVIDSDLVPERTSRSLLARGRIALGSGASVYAEVSYGSNAFVVRRSATPVWGGISANGEPFVLPSASAANPFGADTQFWTRTTALGPRTDEVRTSSRRILAGLEWTVGPWDIDSTAGTSRSRARDDLAGGYASEARYRAALGTGGIDPFGTLATPDPSVLRSTEVSGPARQADSTLDWIDTRATTSLGKYLGRDIGLAAGVELRRERLQDAVTSLLASGDVLGTTAQLSPVLGGRRRAGAGYAEAGAALPGDLSAQLGLRGDWYSDFGFALSPKLAAVWTPSPWAALRGSVARSFRAPSISELHSARLTGLTAPLDDPIRCPGGVAAAGADPALDCGVQFVQLGGGNPGLRPERSTSFNLGLVVRPAPEWQLGVGWWQIAKTGNIGIVRDSTTLDPSTYAGLSSLVTRQPASAADLANGLPGPIALIDTTNRNLGRSRFAGVDFEAAGRVGPLFGGLLDIGADAALVVRAEQELSPGAGTVVLLDRSINGTPVQRWRHGATLTWRRASWSVGARVEGIGSYEDENPDAEGRSVRVGRWWTLGLNAGYAAGPWELGLIVANVFNRAPPFSNKTSAFAVGWDDLTHDPRGRSVLVSVRYAVR